MNVLHKTGPHFYFALLRLMALFRGSDARRAENNPVEALVAGLAIYLISYLFFAQFIPAGLKVWQSALSLVILVFFVCFSWLIALHINSLIIKVLRLGGVFQRIPTRRAQSILLGISASAMAWNLLQRGSWMAEIAATWLLAVAMNLAAAIILAIRNEAPYRAE
jgi:hypothetical protein